MKERNYHAEMKLPEGKTCGDCLSFGRCTALDCTTDGRTSCDFHPRRFRACSACAALKQRIAELEKENDALSEVVNAAWEREREGGK